MGIENVLQRIHTIENRFAASTVKSTALPTGTNMVNTANCYQVQPSFHSLLQDKMSAGSVQDIVDKTAHQYGLDSRLAKAVALCESGFDPNSVSDAGAIGVMQLMPETASSLGVQNPRDPVQNIDGGVRYLKQLLDQFHGDPTLAVAAYNAGPGAVQKYGGVPPFTETQNYVQHVLQAYRNQT